MTRSAGSAPASATITGLRKDRDGGFPARLPPRACRCRLARHLPCRRPMAARGSASPRRRIMMQAIARIGRRPVRRLRRAHEHLRAQPGRGVRQRRAEAALAAAADRRQGQGLLCRHRARTPASTPPSSRPGRCARTATAMPLHGSEDLDLHRAGRDQDAAARAHHAARGGEQAAPRASASSTPTSTAATSRSREIDKMGRKAVDSNQLFIDGLPVPLEDRIGEEGKGFEYILHGMNPERILIARRRQSGSAAPRSRAPPRYAKERIVFDRPIGQNQAIQHPLAALLDGARSGEPDGVQGGLALRRRRALRRSRPTPPSIWPPRRASRPARPRVLTHGGMGYAKEFHVERLLARGR